mmetsp:Transcript_99476/g.301985  ORF Transcript_99476/g.301985 Transcript_99476/m.301985 type:complete len:387 (+) Transcript_99476:1373-2533(+)
MDFREEAYLLAPPQAAALRAVVVRTRAALVEAEQHLAARVRSVDCALQANGVPGLRGACLGILAGLHAQGRGLNGPGHAQAELPDGRVHGALEAREGLALHPRIDPACDDRAEYAALSTPRVGKVGWASWGFAHESYDDCDAAGFRQIAGFNVSCVNAWACRLSNWSPRPELLVRPSDVAEDARGSSVTMLSTWWNDWKFRWRDNTCFGGRLLSPSEVAGVSLDGLRRLIRAIHARSPDVVVAVLALYPGTRGVEVGKDSLRDIAAMNDVVREGLAGEPNTLFVDFGFPADEEMFQTLKPGHPNCRGDKVVATAVVDALFRSGFLSRGLALGNASTCPEAEAADCGRLSAACCQRSALCWPAADGSCVAYGPGQQREELSGQGREE